MAAKVLLIDSGGEVGQTNEVYEFALRDPRILPIKGAGERNIRKLWLDSEPKPGVRLRVVNVDQFKHDLYRLIHHEDPTLWLPHQGVSEDYCLGMASEELVPPR